MSEPIVQVLKNGPLLVKGKLNIVDGDGKALTYEGEQTALCRCGLSTKKPFCDGSHRGKFQS
jgi:CDGSH-type Zn-finger protein